MADVAAMVIRMEELVILVTDGVRKRVCSDRGSLRVRRVVSHRREKLEALESNGEI